MLDKNLEHIEKVYRQRRFSLEKIYRKFRERLFGVDLSIFDDTIAYYREVKAIEIDRREALVRALDKKRHKDAWFLKNRDTAENVMAFYREIDVYPFRQSYNWRFGGFGWYVDLIRHIQKPSVLEYGCGSASLTEWLLRRYPHCRYTVADIPSVTLDSVRWKRQRYQYPYTILEVGPGKQGIPLDNEQYSLIICQDVLEHTLNPLEIVESFIEHLQPNGILVVDFLNAPGGENLLEAAEQRPAVIAFLRQKLFAVKEIDAGGTPDGLYVKADE